VFGNYGLKKNQSRSYLNHLVQGKIIFKHFNLMEGIMMCLLNILKN